MRVYLCTAIPSYNFFDVIRIITSILERNNLCLNETIYEGKYSKISSITCIINAQLFDNHDMLVLETIND